MSDLERIYRDALRWYPKQWRADNENAVVGTLLDQADEQHRDRPARGELLNLRSSGIAARLGVAGRRVPLTVRERAATLTFGLGTAISLAGVLFGGWVWVYADRNYREVWAASALLHGLASGQAIYLIWIAAFVAALFRMRRTTVALLTVSVPVSFVWPLIAISLRSYGHPESVTLGFLDLLAAVSISGAISSQKLPWRILSVSVVGFVALLAGALWLRAHSGGYWGNGARNVDFFWAPLAVWLVFAGIPIALVAAIVLSLGRHRPLAGSVLLAAGPLVPLGLFAFGWTNGVPLIAGVLSLTILGTALLVGVLRLFGLRIRITRA
jgi:hypothetical protein